MKLNLASTRLAFYLIAALVLLVVISAIIPQQDISQNQILDWKEFLGSGYQVIEVLALDRIYFAPYFFILIGLLAINIAVGNFKRFRIVYRTERTLIRARHIGSIIFHLSLLVILSGVVLNYLYKFTGVMALTEGQTAGDRTEEYFRVFKGPLHQSAPSRFQVTLNTVRTDFPVEESLANAAEITMRPADGSATIDTTVLTNRPLNWRNLEFHFGILTGYSPEVQLIDTTGRTHLRSLVRLASLKDDGVRVHSDFVVLPEQNLVINFTVDSTTSEAQEPVCRAVVEWEHDTLYAGNLSPTDTARFGAYELTIPRLRRWCYIDVVESPFLNLVFLGFWAALGGMVIGFIPRLIGSQGDTR